MNKEIDNFIKRHRLFTDEPEPSAKKKIRAHGEGTIRKKGNRYEGRVTVGFTNDGKQIRKSVYADTKQDCVKKMQELIQKVRNGELKAENCPTLIEWLNFWLSEYRKDLAYTSRRRYKSYIAKISETRTSQKKLNNILPLELQQVLNTCTNYEVCKRTIGMLNEAIGVAIDNGYLQRNIAANLRNPLKPPNPTFEDSKKAFTHDEERRFIDEIENNQYRLLYLISLYAGLRRGEVCALTWENIDIENRIIRVKDAATRKGKGYEIGNTKTANSVREVPISTVLYTVLIGVEKKSGFVYSNNGKMVNADVVTMDFTATMKKLGMSHTFHQLRHTFATRCGEKGINIKVVQAWMGHSKTDITVNTYTHATSDLFVKERDKLD